MAARPIPSDPSRPHRSRAFAAVAFAALLAVGLAACGDDEGDVSAGSGDGTTATTAGGGQDDGYGGSSGGTSEDTYIEAKDFSLTSITVAPGAQVKVENQGAATHTVTADDGGFDSGKVGAGSSGSFTAPSAPGAYEFHCEIHPSMTGTLTVEG